MGPDRLPLAKQVAERADRPAAPAGPGGVVAYAGSAGTAVLAPTDGRSEAEDALRPRSVAGRRLDRRRPGYGTGLQPGQGRTSTKGSVNRVILVTDGDFNVGISDPTG
jgi:Ca-activated chloride channel family protein